MREDDTFPTRAPVVLGAEPDDHEARMLRSGVSLARAQLGTVAHPWEELPPAPRRARLGAQFGDLLLMLAGVGRRQPRWYAMVLPSSAREWMPSLR